MRTNRSAALLVCFLAACSETATEVPRRDGVPDVPGPGVVPPAGRPDRVPDMRPLVRGRPTLPDEPLMLPGYHQPLRGSRDLDAATLRQVVPLGRGGERLRVRLVAGDGPLELFAASVARAGDDGLPAGEPVPLTFGGRRDRSAGPRELLVSDVVELPVEAGDDLLITLDVKGAAASGEHPMLPGSLVAAPGGADLRELAGEPEERATLVAGVDVEGPKGRLIVALGDSLTEGLVDKERNDVRASWPGVAQAKLGAPVLNAGVSGQGVAAATGWLEKELPAFRGATDCVVLLGSADLATVESAELVRGLGALYERLAPTCAVWAGTLPPQQAGGEDAERIERRRVEVNEWIRGRADVAGVVDFDEALRDPADPSRFAPGLGGEDGVHPTVEGQRLMGEAAAARLGS